LGLPVAGLVLAFSLVVETSGISQEWRFSKKPPNSGMRQ
jgi:hypothetical protein